MLTFFNAKAKILNQQTYWLILAFFSIRLVSFLVRGSIFLQSFIVISALIILILLFKKNWHYALQFLLAEYLLGGVGHFFELANVSMRTLLTIVFLILYFIQVLKNHQSLNIPRRFIYLLLTFFSWLTITTIIGFYYHNPLVFIIQDLIPFIFILLIFPLKKFWETQANKIFLLRLVFVWLLSGAIWSLLNFILFSKGLVIIHYAYYNWLRDFALAKITISSPYFWRIIFPEQILLIPLIIIISTLWLKYKHEIYLYLLIFSSLMLSLNISRSYFLGLLFGLLALKYKNNWSAWLKICSINFLIIFILFTGINLLSSAGSNTGLGILGLKFGGIIAPQTEISSQNRMDLLKPISNTIKNSLIMGSGLGQSVVTQKINTRQFDWGYLEMWVKWGLLGLFSFMSVIFYLLRTTFVSIKKKPLALGLFGSLIALLVINVTTPALFHVLTIIYLSLLGAIIFNQSPANKIG